ncbi:MAG: hypothetical protein KGM42_20645 [Hyphomicrobiales bacterium]|nr:hypothetical protein [Hyphomicrobiales bacterium]
MSDKPKDPMDAFRDLVGQWERGVNQIANQAMGNEQFSRAMHGLSSAAFSARAGVGEAMEKYLATVNLPSRADIVAIGERLQAIESHLARLTELVALVAGANAPAAANAASKPKRTRQPPQKAGGPS